MRQVDINNTFLNGDLKKDVFMNLMALFFQNSLRVCKLKKALYGLKQAPCARFLKLINYLQQCGFFNTKSDTSLFGLVEEVDITILLVYVNDIIITGNNQLKVKHVIASLHDKLALKDTRLLHYFLGI